MLTTNHKQNTRNRAIEREKNKAIEREKSSTKSAWKGKEVAVQLQVETAMRQREATSFLPVPKDLAQENNQDEP